MEGSTLTAEVLLVGGMGGHAGQARVIGIFLKKCHVNFDVITLKGTEWRFEGLAERVLTAPQVLEPVTARFRPRFLLELIPKLLKLKRYKVVITNGSNFAIPPALWERILMSKLINIEVVDAVIKPTKAPRVLHRFSTLTMVQWEELMPYYPGAEVSGPIYEPPVYEPRDEGYVLVTAGSVGYKKLFDKAVEQLSKNFELVIQTGKVPPALYKDKVKEAFSFSKDFHRWLSRAKAVITTYPGSTSVIASLSYRKPVVIVPNDELLKAAPKENMEPLARKIGAVVSSLDGLEKSLEEALKKRPPKYENGAKKVVDRAIALL